MTGRTLAWTLVAWSCGLATNSWAQGYAPGRDVILPPEAGGFSYSSGAFGDGGPGYGAVAPAGYGATTPVGYGDHASGPPGYAAAPYCPPEPEKSGWWKKRRPLLIGPGLIKPPRGTFFRTEYLLWEIDEPGNELLGAIPGETLDDFADIDFDQTAHPNDPNRIFDDNFDPADGFFTFDPLSGFDFNYVPRIEEIQMRDNSGLRLTLGIPTYEYGTFEFSGWMLEQGSDNYRFGPRELIPPSTVFVNLDDDAEVESSFPGPGVPFAPANLVNVNGENSGLFRVIHSDFLDVTYKSDLWGADAKFVVDALAPEGEGLKFMPLFGFKYMGFQESMAQRGVSSPQFGFGPTTIRNINSDTSNTILGGTVGLRTELVHRWFVVGVQPSVTFAGNIAQAGVSTERFLGNFDPYREEEADYFEFSPVLDLNAYLRVCLTENLHLTVGYDAFWLANIYRPARTIDYNITGDEFNGFQNDVGVKRVDDDLTIEGLSVGFEYVF